MADLQAADTDELVARFGERTGRWLKACAFFHDTSPVQARAAAKSLSSETTFDEDVDDLAALEETIRRLAADVCAGPAAPRHARAHDRDQGPPRRLDQRHPRAHDRDVRPTTTDAITTIALELLRAYAPARPVRLLGVRVASFEDEVAARPSAPVAQLALEV